MKRKISFVHLHVHTEYSLFEGLCYIDKLVKTCKKQKMPAVAITDKNTIAGAYRFAVQCKKYKIKPIIGTQLEVIGDDESDSIILLIKNNDGWNNLSRLITLAHENNVSEPYINKEQLQMYSKGLICIASTEKNSFHDLLYMDKNSEFNIKVRWYISIFGGEFYLEISDFGIPSEKYINAKLIDYASNINLNLSNHCSQPSNCFCHMKLVLSNCCRYIRKETSFAYGVLTCLNNNNETLTYLNNNNETLTCLNNNNETLTCLNNNKEPYQIDEPALISNEYYLKRISEMMNCFLYIGRYAYNTHKISDMIEFDLFKLFPENTMRIKANDIVAELDKVLEGLIFAAFADDKQINVYLPFQKKEDVLRIMKDELQDYHIVPALRYVPFDCRQLLRETGKKLRLDDETMSVIFAEMPAGVKSILEGILLSPDFSVMLCNDWHSILVSETALELSGIFKEVVADTSLYAFIPKNCNIPYSLSKKAEKVSQLEMSDLIRMGFPVLRFIELEELDSLTRCFELIRQKRGIELNPKDISWDDSSTYSLLCRGENKNIFRLESSLGGDALKKFQPKTFRELRNLVALVPLKPNFLVKDYLSGRKKKYYSGDDTLDYILADTYGTIIYHEQVREICEKFAGLSALEARELSENLTTFSKRKTEVLLMKFTQNLQLKEISGVLIKQLVKNLRRQGRYSVSYAVSDKLTRIVYLTAWLKANYPDEFTKIYIKKDKQEEK